MRYLEKSLQVNAALLRPVLAIAAALLLSQVFAHAQKCAVNTKGGCVHSSAPCSPVSAGTGTSGKCVSHNLPPGEQSSCDCSGTPAPALDPRCNNRAGLGQFNCTIVKPTVNKPETVYQSVLFAPGDIVHITADGCVQTGGSGKTWKRYVNPSGDNSDRLYHGLIKIPTATTGTGLVRVSTVVGQNLTVSGTGVQTSDLVLHLGYEDDNYGDNGYTGHDNGTGNQCALGGKVDGGPAHVTVTIVRRARP